MKRYRIVGPGMPLEEHPQGIFIDIYGMRLFVDEIFQDILDDLDHQIGGTDMDYLLFRVLRIKGQKAKALK